MSKPMEQIPEKCATVVLGATWYGCGAAVAAGRETLVIERSMVPGRDFCLTFNPGKDWDAPLTHPLAQAFKAQLLHERALEAGRVTPAALAPFLAEWCLAQNCRMLFSCDLLEVKENSVTFRAVDGVHTVACQRIINAEPRSGSGKSLTALVCARNGTVPCGAYHGFELLPLRSPDLAGLQLPLEAQCSWAEARKKLQQTWHNRPAALADCRILFSAPEFSVAGAPNPLLALERGLKEGSK